LGAFGPLALAAGDAGFLYALDAGGSLAWRLHLPGPPVSAPQPLGADGVVLCATDLGGALVCFDSATGRRRFEAALDFTPTAPAVPFAGLVAVCGTVGGDPVVAAIGAGGTLAWTDAAPLAAPLAACALGSTLIVKTAGGACAAVDRSGELRWSAPREAPHPPPANQAPVAVRRVVLVAGERVAAVDGATGASLGAARVGAPVRLLVGPDLALHAMDAEGLVLAARLATHLSVL
jgi:outer membrane protein assembly factor BamB